MVKHIETCLKINGKQSSGSIEFKNHFKESAVPFKIYADFESLLKEVRGSTLKNIRHMFLAVLLTKLFVVMINLVNRLFFTREKMQSMDLLTQFLKSMIIVKVR